MILSDDIISVKDKNDVGMHKFRVNRLFVHKQPFPDARWKAYYYSTFMYCSPDFCRFPKKGIHHRDTEITEDEMKKGRDPKKPADSTHSGFSFPFLRAG
ncbi:MAG: hypothetical protein D6679_03695 [Candidatus Hydrogenedentota bacterium]|nr:MAG: hypothetical protein D6679_03695 [Candidatus Hydrogenedentota bacterium]